MSISFQKISTVNCSVLFNQPKSASFTIIICNSDKQKPKVVQILCFLPASEHKYLNILLLMFSLNAFEGNYGLFKKKNYLNKDLFYTSIWTLTSATLIIKVSIYLFHLQCLLPVP